MRNDANQDLARLKANKREFLETREREKVHSTYLGELYFIISAHFPIDDFSSSGRPLGFLITALFVFLILGFRGSVLSQVVAVFASAAFLRASGFGWGRWRRGVRPLAMLVWLRDDTAKVLVGF